MSAQTQVACRSVSPGSEVPRLGTMTDQNSALQRTLFSIFPQVRSSSWRDERRKAPNASQAGTRVVLQYHHHSVVTRSHFPPHPLSIFIEFRPKTSLLFYSPSGWIPYKRKTPVTSVISSRHVDVLLGGPLAPLDQQPTHEPATGAGGGLGLTGIGTNLA